MKGPLESAPGKQGFRDYNFCGTEIKGKMMFGVSSWWFFFERSLGKCPWEARKKEKKWKAKKMKKTNLSATP